MSRIYRIGIDITSIHDIANYSTTFHHESLYKNASSKYTSKEGKNRQLKAKN